jgi:uncharacterized membrane protein
MISCLMLALGVGPLAAESLPARYDVSGVAASDRLNVRSGPGMGAEVIGGLAPDAVGVEVTAVNESGRWGRINTDEGTGWVALRYLARQAGSDWHAGETPLRCFGTEPFWSMPIFLPTHRIEFHEPGDGGFELVADSGALPATVFPQTLAVPFSGMRDGMVVIRANPACSDGMSDRLFGLEAQVYWRGDTTGLSGCCTVAD